MVHNKYLKELEAKEEELRKTQLTMVELERNLSGIQDRFNQDRERLIEEAKVYQKK